jgi:predicted metal-dependent hydrolase
MAIKKLEVEGIGTVAFHKRRGARNIRLSITHGGEIRVTLPFWAPYQSGIDFLVTKSDWILAQMPAAVLLNQGYQVGKAHHITFEAGQGRNVSTRLTGNEVRVLLPVGTRWDSPEAQKAAESAGIRALKKEAKRLLPSRLKLLAGQHGYDYGDVSIKQLKGRWGSCSEQKDIVLNCFLMKLPWDLIDYVLLHELAHTRVMAHGTVFWDEMKRSLPNIQQLRKDIKTHKPIL